MKITQIAGFLGCGKTTLLLKLSRLILGDNERKVALVVNEIGEIPVDGKIMEESGMQVKDIGGGCICCEVAATFAKTIYRLYKDFAPDHVLVEPTGVAVPHQVKLAARMGGRDAKISMGPAIVLFDATRPAFYYVRVLEIPTPRHSVFDAIALGLDAKEIQGPWWIQERAYTSPIWYEPR